MNQNRGIHTGIGRVAVSATLAGLLGIGMMAIPTTAFAEMTTTRSYTWNDGDQQPTAAQTVTSNGVTYTLAGTSTPVKSGSDSTLTQSFTTTLTGTASSVNDVQSAVPSSTPYSDDGYSGTLYRTSVSYTPVYVTQDLTDTATRTRQIAGAVDNHPEDSTVPKTIYQNGHQLTRTSITWEKTNGDSQGSLWTYTAQYSGTYQKRTCDHYDVTGTYSGNLTKTVSGGTWSMTATYTAPDQQQDADNTGDTQTLGDDQNANQDDTQSQDANDVTDSVDNADNAESGYEMQNVSSDDGTTDGNEGTDTGANDGILGMVQAHPFLLLIPVILIIAIIAAIVAAARKKHAAAGAVVAPLAVPADIYGLNAELIEFVNDGTDENQRIIATCDAYMSPDANTPNLVEIPQPPMRFEPAATVDENGDPVYDEEGNQVYDDYYIVISDTSYDAVASGVTDETGYAVIEGVPNGHYVAITESGQPQPVIVSNDTAMETELVDDGSESDLDAESITRDNVGFVPGDATVRVFVRDADGNPLDGKTVDLLSDGLLADAKSSRLVIESNGQAIYDGTLATQVKVDSKLLADALNDECTDGEGNDITEDVDRWLNTYEDYDEHRNEVVAQIREQREAEAQAAADAQDTSSIPTDTADGADGSDDSIEGFDDEGEDDDFDTADTTMFQRDDDQDAAIDGDDDDLDDDLSFDDADDDDPENAR